MLTTCYFDFLENISLSEEIVSNFYEGIKKEGDFFPETIYFFPSLHAPILLQRDGISRPCVFYRENKNEVVIKTEVPSGYRKVRDRYLPSGSAGVFIRRHYNPEKDIRWLILNSMKPFFRKDVRYLTESRTEGLFEIDSNKKFLTLNSWVLGSTTEIVTFCPVPEITEEMKIFCDEKKYIGFKNFLKPEFQNLFVFYKSFFYQLVAHFYET